MDACSRPWNEVNAIGAWLPFGANTPVAWTAERPPVADIKPQIRVLGVGQDVINLKAYQFAHALMSTAPLAGVVITFKHRTSEGDVLRRTKLLCARWRGATSPIWMLRATLVNLV